MWKTKYLSDLDEREKVFPGIFHTLFLIDIFFYLCNHIKYEHLATITFYFNFIPLPLHGNVLFQIEGRKEGRFVDEYWCDDE